MPKISIFGFVYNDLSGDEKSKGWADCFFFQNLIHIGIHCLANNEKLTLDLYQIIP